MEKPRPVFIGWPIRFLLKTLIGQCENRWKHKWVIANKYSSNNIFRIGDKNPLEAFFEKHQINQLEIIQNLTQRANAES